MSIKPFIIISLLKFLFAIDYIDNVSCFILNVYTFILKKIDFCNCFLYD
ncbi:hypothetical protein D922_00331 [Enterococcus faecalis 06-MB-DW-09]|nr:hypothetical protein D922_00331 [Enterococcus faecalis 06-MB-DW-09]